MIPYRSSIRVLAASAPNMARSASAGVTGFCVGLYAFILNHPENSLKRQERVHNPSEVKIYPLKDENAPAASHPCFLPLSP